MFQPLIHFKYAEQQQNYVALMSFNMWFVDSLYPDTISSLVPPGPQRSFGIQSGQIRAACGRNHQSEEYQTPERSSVRLLPVLLLLCATVLLFSPILLIQSFK